MTNDKDSWLANTSIKWYLDQRANIWTAGLIRYETFHGRVVVIQTPHINHVSFLILCFLVFANNRAPGFTTGQRPRSGNKTEPCGTDSTINCGTHVVYRPPRTFHISSYQTIRVPVSRPAYTIRHLIALIPSKLLMIRVGAECGAAHWNQRGFARSADHKQVLVQPRSSRN